MKDGGENGALQATLRRADRRYEKKESLTSPTISIISKSMKEDKGRWIQSRGIRSIDALRWFSSHYAAWATDVLSVECAASKHSLICQKIYCEVAQI
jgi:hypothetical protein